jgi:hypothetical protein
MVRVDSGTHIAKRSSSANQIVKSAEIRAPERADQNVPNPWVQFRIDDVYVPEPVQILMELHGQDVLLGRIIDVSDSQIQSEPFAVIEVEGLSQPVVVAMKHLKEIHRE